VALSRGHRREILTPPSSSKDTPLLQQITLRENLELFMGL
jgi:hypothetical protein